MPLKLYKTYVFRDKDPVIDVVRTVVEDSKKTWTNIALESGVSRNTLRNWFLGTTKRPQFATIAAVVSSCGFSIRIGSTPVVTAEPQRAKARIKRYGVPLNV